jgi:hypothetical protein
MIVMPMHQDAAIPKNRGDTTLVYGMKIEKKLVRFIDDNQTCNVFGNASSIVVDLETYSQ